MGASIDPTFSYLCMPTNYTLQANFFSVMLLIFGLLLYCFFSDSILTSIEDRIKDREEAASLQEEWSNFLLNEGQALFLYACKYGTVETVKYFIKHGESSTERYVTDAMDTMEHNGVAGWGGKEGNCTPFFPEYTSRCQMIQVAK